MSRRPSIRDVAEHAGVSPSTVSVVLNDVTGARVAAATRRRVLEAAHDLGYAADATARALRTRRTHTIGFISDAIATTPFAGRMIQGAQDAAWRKGMLMLLLNTGGDAEHEREAIRALVQRRVDGMLYATWYHRVVDVPRAPAGIPMVLLDARPAAGAVPFVVPDERAGAAAAVTELLERGHRRIGFAQDVEDVPAAAERLHGYRETLAAAGIAFDRELVAAGKANVEGGHEALRRLLEIRAPPTAVFCFNDRMAFGVYQACAARGLHVPEDLSVVGFDDQPELAESLSPGLTTVALPHYEMGAWGVEALMGSPGAEGGDDADGTRMPCRLVRRSSVGPPRARSAI